MTRFLIIVGLCLGLAPGVVQAQTNGIDLGKQEYMIACAGCHGASAKGTGPLASLLSIETPDLTRINERTGGGMFPYRNTALLIDGRNDIRAHGGDMPIWGNRFMMNARSSEEASEIPESAELVTMGRILALVLYLESIQE